MYGVYSSALDVMPVVAVPSTAAKEVKKDDASLWSFYSKFGSVGTGGRGSVHSTGSADR